MLYFEIDSLQGQDNWKFFVPYGIFYALIISLNS